jgi:hypothetical protein
MNLKSAALSVLLGGLIIFVWGALAHLLPPEPVTTLTDTKAVDDFAAKFTPTNGAFIDPRGFMVITGFLPGKPDKSQDMSPQLILELLTNFLQAGLLYFILTRLKPASILGYGTIASLLGLLAWVSLELSYWNWYSFPFSLIFMGFLDASIGFFLAGCLMGWQIRKAQ